MEFIFLFGVIFGVVGGVGVTNTINKKPCIVDQKTMECMVLKGESK